MKLSLHLFVILFLADTLFARPIHDPSERKSVSWKNYIPVAAAVGILASLAGIVFLGTKADEAYNSLQIVENAKDSAKFTSLPSQDQAYVNHRMTFIDKDLSSERAEELEALDLMHGWPKFEMMDTTKMKPRQIRELRKVYQTTKNALETAKRAAEVEEKMKEQMKQVASQASNARFHATVTLGTNWRDMVNKIKASESEQARK
jgi:hypothetical protein